MKKLILVLTAFAAFTSCSKDEVVDKPTAQAITFDNVFVENSTRAAYDASYTKSRLSEFEVYGTINNGTETANIFNQEKVELNSGLWKYDEAKTQYWIPGNSYNFAAIVDGNISDVTEVVTDANFMPTKINVYDASQQKDILYAANNVGLYNGGAVSPVAFTFDHLLSKAKFTVKNTIETNSGYSYKVSNITITGAIANGVYDIASQTWSAADEPETYNLSFGNAVTTATEAGAAADFIGFGQSKESNFERLIVPTFAEDDDQKTTVKVSFTREYFYNEVSIRSEVNTLSVDVQLLAGRAYNFVVKLGNPGEPIEFTVNEVNNWDTNHAGYTPGVDMK